MIRTNTLYDMHVASDFSTVDFARFRISLVGFMIGMSLYLENNIERGFLKFLKASS